MLRGFVREAASRRTGHSLGSIIYALSQGAKQLDYLGARFPWCGGWLADARPLPERFQRVTLHFQVGAYVPIGRRNARMAQIIADDSDIDPGL